MNKYKKYRPWGQLKWLLSRLPKRKWDVLGCISTEERSLSAIESLIDQNQVNTANFITVKDPDSFFEDEISDLIKKRKLELNALFNKPTVIPEFKLITGVKSFVDKVKLISETSEDLVLDISGFPKRFFFPAVKIILQSKNIRNLIVSYSIPEKYSDKLLAEDAGDWECIPTFDTTEPQWPDIKYYIVGVGYLALGLADHLQGDNKKYEVRLLFPFPPGPPSYERNWKFIQQIADNLPLGPSQIPARVPARDVSDVFDYIRAITQDATYFSLLAPYGPKPMSLAMCLFAIQSGFPVYYTQPSVYTPDYSTGKSLNSDGEPEVYGYAIRLNGTDLYNINE